MRKYYFSLRSNLQLLAFASLFFTFSQLNAQVGIGTTNPQAMLDVVASDPANPTAKDGFLMPRVTSLSQDFQEPPAVGTMVFYNGALTGNMKHTVYYYADDSNWRNLSGEIANSSDEPELFDYDEDNGGVIFWIDPNDAYHYKIVALRQFAEDYGSNNNNSDNGGRCDQHFCAFGANGFEAAKSWIDEHSSIVYERYDNYAPSMAYYYDGDNDPGTEPLGWYLPTMMEMQLILNNRSSINNAMNGETHDDIQDQEKYWTIMQGESDDKSFVLEFEGDYKISEENKKDPREFRIVREIGG